MITKINSLTDFGIYKDFKWADDPDLPDFRKFNLIYGWNRSGKTTLSRVFSACEKKMTYDEDLNSHYPENGRFSIKNDSQNITNQNIELSTMDIKVFNQDFIDENVFFNSKNPCKPIVYISNNDQSEVEELENLLLEIENYEKNIIPEKRKIKSDFEKINEKILTAIGTSISKLKNERSYNRSNVQTKIDEIGFEKMETYILSDENYKNKLEFYQTKETQPIDIIETNDFSSLPSLREEANILLKINPITESIERLNDDKIINWVNEGYKLHKDKNHYETCLFCGQSIKNDLFDNLENYFNDNFSEYISNLKDYIEKIRNIKVNRILNNKDKIFANFRDDYNQLITDINNCFDQLEIWRDNSLSVLDKKILAVQNIDLSIDEVNLLVNEIDTKISEINKIIEMHEDMRNNLNAEKIEVFNILELHMIAIGIKESDYVESFGNFNSAKTEFEQLSEILNQKKIRYESLRNKNSSVGGAIIEINKYLQSIFGRKEIELKVMDNERGYQILNNGYLAKHLSEGEKTAIAFSFFIAKMKEEGVDKKNTIVFIDDPISSFDSNFIFYSYSLIKSHFSDVKQLFISTHNFRLFNLIKEWFIEKYEKLDDGTKIPLSQFYMIENNIIGEKRAGNLCALDKTLKNYKSEYHFLFKTIYSFAYGTEEENSFKDYYIIGNIARRFFEIYSGFKLPHNGSVRNKLDQLAREYNQIAEESDIISFENIENIYKVFNAYSHNSEPTCSIEHIDKLEVKTMIELLLNLVIKTDKKHYSILVEKCI